jgi:hypothetical protein
MSDWGRLSKFMDGRFLNVARIGFEIIMSENKSNELGKKFERTEKWKKLELNDKFLIK